MQEALEAAIRKSGVRLTLRAAFLVLFVLESISDEERWARRSFRSNKPAERFLKAVEESLPSVLERLQDRVNKEYDKDPIVTVFDVLHHFEQIAKDFFPRNMFFPGKL